MAKTKYDESWEAYEKYIRECEANNVPVKDRLSFQQWQKLYG